MTAEQLNDVTTIILAGGEGKRLQGQDKGLLPLQGQTLIEHLLQTVSPLTERVIISANRNLERYQRFHYPVVQDGNGQYEGPLAGIAAALKETVTPLALILAADAPFISRAVIKRLYGQIKDHDFDIVSAHDGRLPQPLCSIMHTHLEEKLARALAAGERQVRAWMEGQHHRYVDCADMAHCFFNINRPEDLEQAQKEP